MVRTLLTLAGLALLASGAGCSMCAHPYDDCYPTFTGGCDGAACQGPRAGSIRARGGVVAATAAPAEAMPVPEAPEVPSAARPKAMPVAARAARAPASQPVQRGPVPMYSNREPRHNYQVSPEVWQAIPAQDRATAKIISVTDRAADEPAAASGGAQVATQPQTTAVR